MFTDDLEDDLNELGGADQYNLAENEFLDLPDSWAVFSGKDAKILTYTDADYAQQADHHSISGYCLIFGAGAISWSLKKQNIVTLSSTEAEYIRHTNAIDMPRMQQRSMEPEI